MNAKSMKPALAAAALIAAATLACGLLSPTAAPTPAAPAPVAAGDSAELFQDDFKDSTNWELDADSDYVIDYAEDAIRIKLWSGEYFGWTNLLGRSFKNVHIEVTAKDQSTDTAHSFGIVCDQQTSGGHATIAHYWLGLDPNGYYEIGKRVVGKDDKVLTGNGDWALSDAFPKKAKSYQLGADCGNGIVALYVNGVKLASVQDDTFAEGGIGLFVWSGDGSAGPVSFDDVVVTRLK